MWINALRRFGKYDLFRQDLGVTEKVFSRRWSEIGKIQEREGQQYNQIVTPGVEIFFNHGKRVNDIIKAI